MDDDVRITNQVLGPVTGKVVQVGHADSVAYAGTPPARSRYLEWVRTSAPRELIGRSEELAELARFCTAADGLDYVWFRAEPWTGKSALMASFVLAPPGGVRIVSFFVTARSAGDDTREAFVDVVQEQLAEILGTAKDPKARNLPAVFADAAARCRTRSERLVLVVDGLDEDRSAGGHSIAALLPYPSDGLRVIVASRLNPDVPADVRSDHPLRAPGIERLLSPSPAARFARGDMERELDALLSSEPDLLGLLVAARGGLTAPDLAELTGQRPRDVERILNSVASRSFSRRPAHWRSGDAPEIYLLGHESLQRAAEDALGVAALDRYRSALVTWARGYRDAGWPSDTPQFLLRGYFWLVQEAADVAALADLAADPHRHQRLLDVSGSDAAALAELDDASAAALGAAEPDLVRVITLETYRENVRDRNRRIPARLPAVWAELGEAGHALALAEAMTDPGSQRIAFIMLAGALVRAGQLNIAQQLSDNVDDQSLRGDLRAEISLVLIETGRRTEAIALMDGDLREDHRKQIEAHLAIARADPDFARAVRRTAEISSGAVQSKAFDRLGELVMNAHPELAEKFVQTADAHPGRSLGRESIAVAYSLCERGEAARARMMLAQHDLNKHDRLGLFVDLMAADDLHEAAAASRFDVTEDDRSAVLVDALAKTGQLSGIPAVLDSIAESSRYRLAASWYLAALAERGESARAAELATSFRSRQPAVDSDSEIAAFLMAITDGLLRAGDRVSARDFAAKAEREARRPVLGDYVVNAVTALARAAADSRDIRRAENLAALIPADQFMWNKMAEFVELLAAEGDPSIAEKVITRLQSCYQVRKPMVSLARRLRRAGDAAALARLAAHVHRLIELLDENERMNWRHCLTMMCAVGRPQEITDVIDRFRQVSPQMLDYPEDSVAELAARGESGIALELCDLGEGGSPTAMSVLVAGLAEAGWADEAESIVERAVEKQKFGATLLSAFVRGVARCDLERALSKAAQIGSSWSRSKLLVDLAAHADPKQRKRILAEAAAIHHWSAIVPALDADELSDLLNLADRFGSLYHPNDPDA
ncbi:hypothetical protein ACFORO_31240 [Amycolatopsis halotolerans]|uniref:NACHT domain-containing protein n=1 Tax=Amycolatopsis halotolerans TaxID=330083 RepID=A0ABV7QNC3_9PSEU